MSIGEGRRPEQGAFPLGPEFYLEYSESARALEDLAFFGAGQTTVRSGEHVERLFVASGPPSLFSTLGVRPVVGRLPNEDDAEGRVAVLSHWLWSDWFGRASTWSGDWPRAPRWSRSPQSSPR